MPGKKNTWQFKKEVNLGVVIQLCFMASLVLGSWLNLESRLDALQHDVDTLLKQQDHFSGRIEELTADNLRHQYRLDAIERHVPKEGKM
jgi:hypothetical protein